MWYLWKTQFQFDTSRLYLPAAAPAQKRSVLLHASTALQAVGIGKSGWCLQWRKRELRGQEDLNVGSRREVTILQHDLEAGRNNTTDLLLHCYLSLGPRDLSCGVGAIWGSQIIAPCSSPGL